ncbi:MAG: hypothetical protein E6R03_08380 [Hyphomicrobiaceae bacterium]|nr:MAG: hypothetical protein E6R03_08380 [Hyphomicrobiaceae bacterium]
MTPTVSQGWIPTDTILPIAGHTYEVLCAGGRTYLAYYEPGHYTVTTPPDENGEGGSSVEVENSWWHMYQPDLTAEGALGETVYAWRVALSGWEPFPAADRPWFPIASAARLRAGCLVEVLCHDGKTGLAWLQLQEPTAEHPEGELGWEWMVYGFEKPEPAFWRFHIDSRNLPAESSNLTLQLHPTVRKHNLFFAEMVRPPVAFEVPVSCPGYTPAPSFPSLLEGTSPEVELVEVWAALNDLATWASDPSRNSAQLYFLAHRLGNLWGPLDAFIEERIAQAAREGR